MTIIWIIIKSYAQWLYYKLNKPYRDKRKALATKRLIICENCPYFYKHTRNCSICGCFCDIKTKADYDIDENEISIDGCPEKMW